MGPVIEPIVAHGVFGTYGYFVADEETGHALLIDPGAQPELFARMAQRRGWEVEAILLTHGHFDHTGAVGALREAWGCPVYAHELAPRYLMDSQLNLSAMHGLDVRVPDVLPLRNGGRLELAGGAVALDVLHVPGHTDDSCAFYLASEGVAFVGDAVYDGGPGLTVFPTGDAVRLHESICGKLLTLPPDTTLLSGHYRPMTVAELAAVMGVVQTA